MVVVGEVAVVDDGVDVEVVGQSLMFGGDVVVVVVVPVLVLVKARASARPRR